jgi:rubrerythrin
LISSLFKKGERPARSGLDVDKLDPPAVWYGTDVLLAQADTLQRLARTTDHRRKLLWAMSVAADCIEAHPESSRALINAARVARADKKVALAERLLSAAENLRPQKLDQDHLLYEKNQLDRERVAGGSLEAMIMRLVVYACQNCGRLVEYISVPCMCCGWRPRTVLEISHSTRLSTIWFKLWEVMGIGREIHFGHKATDVVPNMAEVASDLMRDETSLHRQWVNSTIEAIENNNSNTFFSFLEASRCLSCGRHNARHDANYCSNCHSPLSVPPPLRLLKGLTRLSIHLQQNFEAPQSTDFDMFIRFLVSLQSKLFRMQETPTDRERTHVINSMKTLQKFDLVNGLGTIRMADPSNISYEFPVGLPDEKNSTAKSVLTDLAEVLQFVASWMLKTRTLS